MESQPARCHRKQASGLPVAPRTPDAVPSPAEGIDVYNTGKCNDRNTGLRRISRLRMRCKYAALVEVPGVTAKNANGRRDYSRPRWKSAANGYSTANRPHCRINCSRDGPRGMILEEVDAPGIGFAALSGRDHRAQALRATSGRSIAVSENVKATRGRQSRVGPHNP
jgi:hypothetical protein